MQTDRYPEITSIQFQIHQTAISRSIIKLIKNCFIIQYFNRVDSTGARTEMSFCGNFFPSTQL